MTQTIYFGTTCPKAGFGEAPQQAFLRPSRDAKIASVATLALLAVSASHLTMLLCLSIYDAGNVLTASVNYDMLLLTDTVNKGCFYEY